MKQNLLKIMLVLVLVIGVVSTALAQEPVEENGSAPKEEATESVQPVAPAVEESVAAPVEESVAAPVEGAVSGTDEVADPLEENAAEPIEEVTNAEEVSAASVVDATSDFAVDQPFVSSITFYTPSDTGGTLNINLYAKESGTAIALPAQTLAAHAAGSIFMGTQTGVASGFLGSAVLSSDVPVLATAVQLVQSGSYPRPLYTGFTTSDGATNVFIATYLKQVFNSSSQLAIQNIDTTPTDITVKFYELGKTTPKWEDTKKAVPGQAMVYYDAQAISNIPAAFNGSVSISTSGGKVVATVQENGLNNREAYAFEGVSNGGKTVYMPSMTCKAYSGQISYYAIQNMDLTQATKVTVAFYGIDGKSVGSLAATEIVAGGKISVNPCEVSKLTAGSTDVAANTAGSAVITSDTTNIIAIGKVKKTGGFATAFLGQSSGSLKVAAPYIRWAKDTTSEARMNIAIMNVGTAAANSIKVKYYDGSGTLKATHEVATSAKPLDKLIKVNSNADTASALQTDKTFGISSGTIKTGGSVEIESDQPIVVVVRGQRDFAGVGTLAEDYNAQPVQ